MAKKVIERLIDDLDGGDADETVEFGMDSVGYTIDLSTKNAAALREVLGVYVAAGTRLSRPRAGRPAARAASNSTAGRNRNVEIRQWAHQNGHEIADRGRIPTEVVAAFDAAQARR